jgi:hypothetical protein
VRVPVFGECQSGEEASREGLAVDDRAASSAARLARVRAVVGDQRTLEDVVRWGLALSPPALVADVVVQDEYTHDVVLPFEDVFLVYDTT